MVELKRQAESTSSLQMCFSGIIEPVILQSSTDMKNWTEILLMTSDFNGLQIELPIKHNKKFFRLKKLDHPIKFQLNKFPDSDHLGRIVSGRELQIDFFGTRDIEGYPSRVTRVQYQLGKQLYFAELDNQSNDLIAKSDIPKIKIETRQIEYISGYIIVSSRGVCSLAKVAPVISYRTTENRALGKAQEVTGETVTVYQNELSDDTRAVYRYNVPWLFKVTEPLPTQTDRIYNGIVSALQHEYEDIQDPLTISMDAFLEASEKIGGVVPNLPTKLTLIAVNAATTGLAFYEGYRVDSHYQDYILKDILVGAQTVYKAILPNGDDHFLFSSQSVSVTINEETRNIEAPTLFIEPDCDRFLTFEHYSDVHNKPYIRNEIIFQDSNTLYEYYQNFDYIEGASSFSKSSVRQLASVGRASANISFSASTSSINYNSILAVSSDTHQIKGTVIADGRFYFKIRRPADYNDVNFVDVDLKTSGNTTEISGTLLTGVYPIFKQSGSTASVISLGLSSPYGVDYFSRENAQSSVVLESQGSLTLSILGQKRDIQMKYRRYEN